MPDVALLVGPFPFHSFLALSPAFSFVLVFFFFLLSFLTFVASSLFSSLVCSSGIVLSCSCPFGVRRILALVMGNRFIKIIVCVCFWHVFSFYLLSLWYFCCCGRRYLVPERTNQCARFLPVPSRLVSAIFRYLSRSVTKELPSPRSGAVWMVGWANSRLLG